MKIRSILASLLLLATAPLFAQEGQAMPKPGAEHQLLAAKAGVWDATLEMMGSPTKSTGVSTVTVACGGFWVVDDFKADMGGMPFHGHGATGYDPAKGKYVGSWIDSMTPSLMTLEGTMDKAGKVLTMSGMAPGMDGKPVMHRMVTTQVDATTQTFEMFVPGPDGKDMKVMTITYKKRGEKSGEKAK